MTHPLAFPLGPLENSGVIILKVHSPNVKAIRLVSYDIEYECCGKLLKLNHRSIKAKITGLTKCRVCGNKDTHDRLADLEKTVVIPISGNWQLMPLTGQRA